MKTGVDRTSFGASHEDKCYAAPELPRQFDPPLSRCPLCESDHIALYDRDYTGLTLSRCRRCGLQFMNPQYTDAYLDQYYARYFSFGRTDLKHLQAGDPDQENRQVQAKQNHLQLIQKLVDPGRFLSVGCGNGLELLLAQRMGWQAEGFDVDPEYTSQIQTQTGLTVHSGDLFQLRLPADSYDCLFLDQVLEHPKRPSDYLVEAHRLLRPGGILFIGCPNIGSISNRLKTWQGKLGLKRRRGRHYDMYHHLFYYTPRRVAHVLECHFGFRCEVVQGDPFNGYKSVRLTGKPLERGLNWLRCRWPFLESGFRLLARKKDSLPRTCHRRHAA